jgi:hypothetical protein
MFILAVNFVSLLLHIYVDFFNFVVCQQHKPLHRKTISNEKSSTKDEGCINKEQKSPELQWKRACNT